MEDVQPAHFPRRPESSVDGILMARTALVFAIISRAQRENGVPQDDYDRYRYHLVMDDHGLGYNGNWVDTFAPAVLSVCASQAATKSLPPRPVGRRRPRPRGPLRGAGSWRGRPSCGNVCIGPSGPGHTPWPCAKSRSPCHGSAFTSASDGSGPFTMQKLCCRSWGRRCRRLVGYYPHCKDARPNDAGHCASVAVCGNDQCPSALFPSKMDRRRPNLCKL